MIIFGVRSGAYKPVKEPTANCDHCGSVASVHMLFAVRYFHIFWIPVFPLGKLSVSECTHCRQSLYPNEMPAGLQVAYSGARKQARTPVKYFSGLLLVAAFFAAATVAGLSARSHSAGYLLQPLAGDVYEIQQGKIYTLYRVEDVEGDSVAVRIHEYEARNRRELRELKRDYKDDYTEEVYRFSKTELQALYDAHTIKNVDRE